jgi:hypothetical protein
MLRNGAKDPKISINEIVEMDPHEGKLLEKTIVP